MYSKMSFDIYSIISQHWEDTGSCKMTQSLSSFSPNDFNVLDEKNTGGLSLSKTTSNPVKQWIHHQKG